MAISLPLSCCSFFSLDAQHFYYQKNSPAEILEIVAGNNPIIAKEETDFSEPDSPTIPGFHSVVNHN
jgi:hypothetical protein